MYPLTEGAVEKIANGIEVDKPVLQILGYKKLSSSSSGERYRLLTSDGVRVNSFTMLTTQLNYMITDNIVTEYSVCEITKYATSMVNKSGKQQRVMIILNLEVKVPGSEVGRKLGNPKYGDNDNDDSGSSVQAQQPEKMISEPVAVAPVTPKRMNIQQPSDISVTPIIALSPYQNRWVIRARVLNKSTVRTWSNSRGSGTLFSMDLADESGEIRCTAFRAECDKFYDMIEIGKVYYISRCMLKTANKQFSNINNDYEMTLTKESEVIPCHDEVEDIPKLKFNFVPISEVNNKEKNDIIDILGVVQSTNDLHLLTARTSGRELKKRDIHLVDDSNTMITLTLWGKDAEEFDGRNNPILAVKAARIGEFNGGKTLSTISSTVIQTDPDIEAAHRLRGWFNSCGKTEDMRSLSKPLGGGGLSGQWLTLLDAREKQLGCKGNPEVYMVKACISMIRVENAVYKSCPTDNCKKKVIDQNNEMYRCEKCNREFPNFKYRLIAGIHLADWSDSQWATAFHEEAEQILGITAQELGELRENDNDAYLDKFGEASFKTFIFKIRVNLESFNDERRLKASIAGVTPVDYRTYNAHLISEIKDIMKVGTASKSEF